MTKKQVDRRPEAKRDVNELSAHLGDEGGVHLELRFLDAAEAAFSRLLEMPELGARREFRNSRLEGLRMWPIPDFPKHLIFYKPIETGIEVVRVLYGRRDLEALFEER